MSMAMADYDRDGFLDLYLCTYSYFIGASEDKAGPPTPVPRRAERPAQRAAAQRRPRPLRGRRRARPASTRTTTASASPPPGATTTTTAGPTCSWPTTSAARTCTTTGAAGRQGDVQGRDRRRRSRGPRRGHERRLARLRQRRPPRHLHRQHVDGGGAAHHGRARLHARRARRGAGALPPPRARQLALPQPRRRQLRGRDARGARRDGPLGLVLGRARLRQRRLGRPLRRERHVHARAADTRTWTASSGARSWRARRSRASRARRTTTPGAPSTACSADASQASHQRNVFLRNDGQGGFDEVSGSAGARPRPGRPLVRRARLRRRRRPGPRRDGGALGAAAPRSSGTTSRDERAALALRLAGTQEQPRRRRRAGDGGDRHAAPRRRSSRRAPASSRSTRRSCCSASARAGGSSSSTVRWPSGATQVLADVPLDQRVRSGGGRRRRASSRSAPRCRPRPRRGPRARRAACRRATWLYEPFPAPDFELPDLDGAERARSRACAGGPALVALLGDGRAGVAAGARRRSREARRLAGPASARSRSPSTRPRTRRRSARRPGASRALPVALGRGGRGHLRDPQPLPVRRPRRTCGCRRSSS